MPALEPPSLRQLELREAHRLGISKSKYGRKEATGVVSGLIIILSFALVMTRLGPLCQILPAILRVAASSISIPILMIVSTSVSHDTWLLYALITDLELWACYLMLAFPRIAVR